MSLQKKHAKNEVIAQRFLAEYCEGARGAQRKRKLASEFADETVATQAIKDRLAGYRALARAGVISQNLADEAEKHLTFL